MLLNSRKETVVQTKAFIALKDYLKKEAYNKKEIRINSNIIKVIHANVPQQPNHYDCGVYLIQYIETFFKDTEKYLDYILVVLIIMKGAKDQQEDWFRESAIGYKRQEIKKLIETLAQKIDRNLSSK